MVKNVSECTENPAVNVCYFGLFSFESSAIKGTELTSYDSENMKTLQFK